MNARTLTGWRWWQVSESGYLSGFHTPYARAEWPSGTDVTAVCNQDADSHGPQDAPWPDCECGVRLMPELADLLAGIRNEPERTGITPHVWRLIGGADYHEARKRDGVLYVPDVIGEVVASGRLEDACPWDDPPGTVRAERARVGTRLYVSRHLWRYAPVLRANYPHARIHVGRRTGLAWLDEVRKTEAATAKKRAKKKTPARTR